MALLQRAKQRDMLPIATRVLSQRLHASKHRQIDEFDDVGEAMVRSISMDEDGQPRPFPVQVDGDYIGEHTELDLRCRPGRADDRCLAYGSRPLLGAPLLVLRAEVDLALPR